MKKQYRVLLLIVLCLSFMAVLFSTADVVSSNGDPEYQVFLPLVSKIAPPSHYSTSWYITKDLFNFTNGKRNIYYKGVQAGNLTSPPGRQDQLIILHFGRPRTDGIQVGTRAYNDTSGGLTSTNDIIIYSKDFINGFIVGALAKNDTESKLELGVGTSNLNWDYYAYRSCEGYFCTTGDAYNHGKAWAQMIATLNVWVIQQGYADRVSVAGATDIELAWNSALISHAWVRGFDENDQGKYVFYNFGTCEGCDIGINLNTPPNPYKALSDDWTHAKVHYSAWGAGSAWPIPEIYLNNGWNANQWANISKVGVMLGHNPMYF
ncbi:MAG TPA: hypothetical protein VK856_07400, partial [Anaerolineaceae bacterium]|nr:hypothetical protein [Anaerolineaceae bacterium]